MTPRTKSLLAVALVFTLGFYETRQAARLTERIAAVEQSAAQSRLATARRRADLTDENTRLRAEIGRLHAEALAASQARAQSTDAAAAEEPSLSAMADWLERVLTLKARIKAHPEITIPEMAWLEEQDWLQVAKDNPLADDNDYRRAASRLRTAAEDHFGRKAFFALRSYLKAHDDKFPADVTQLQPYFEPPIDPAILQRWVVKPAKEVWGIGVGGDWVITQKSAVDKEMDPHSAIGLGGYGSTGP